ncbi:MAG: nuclear transport factor 2 family protein [Comamonadaceae bacterium]|nr:MAG: nuclear transport factor 2 family protein [Comamonadaceae bacterium]
MNMPAIATLVDGWLAAYADPDAARRLAAIREAWNLDGRLVDPPMEARGHQGISDQAATLLAQFPGHRFERSTAIDAHHQFLRYGWKLVDANGAAVLEGIDVVELDVDGRLLRVVGFFGAQPPAW